MIIILSTYEYEGSTMDILNWLTYKKGIYKRINGKDIEQQDFLKIEISNENTQITLKNKDLILNLDNIHVIWFRRWYNYAFALEDLNIFSIEKENRQLKKHIIDEFKNLSVGFYKLLEQNTPYWLSHPNYVSPNKLISLLTAKSVGLNIPKTIITNDRKTLQQFKEVNNEIITKNIGEVKTLYQNKKGFSTYTTTIEDDFIESSLEHFAPTKFQNNIDKAYEIRSFILEDEIYSMAIFSQLDSQTKTDFRQYNEIKPNRNVPYKLPENLESKLLLFMKKMNLNTGSIDLIKTKSEEYIFLEVNPVGQFSMVSFPCNYHLEEKIADLLIQKDKEHEKHHARTTK